MACGLCVEAVACDLCAGVAAHGMVACAATLVALCAVSRLAGSRRASTDGSNYCVRLQPGIAVCTTRQYCNRAERCTYHLPKRLEVVVAAKHLLLVERAQYGGCSGHCIEW